MPEICPKCGNSFIEGQLCKCSILNFLKVFFKRPYSFVVLSARQNLYNSLLLVCIQAAIIGTFSIILIKRLVIQASEWLPAIDKGLGLGGWFEYSGYSFDIPYIEIFIKVFLFILIQFIILAGFFFVCGKLFNVKKTNFKSIICVTGSSSLISSFFFLIAILGIPLFPPMIKFTLLLGFISTLLLNHASIRDIFEINENKAVYLTSTVYFLYFFIINVFIVESLKRI